MANVKYNADAVPLQGKILAYNEAAGRMEWMDLAETAYEYEVQEFTASTDGTQTSFTFTEGTLVDSGDNTPKVYINGSNQSFTRDGNTITLAGAADSGATLRILNTISTPLNGMMLQYSKPNNKTTFKTFHDIIRDSGGDSAEHYGIPVFDSDAQGGGVGTKWSTLADIVGNGDSSGRKDNAFIAFDSGSGGTKWLSFDSALAVGADSAQTGDILIFDADAVDPDPKLKFSRPMVSIPIVFSDTSAETVNVSVKKGAYVSGSPAPTTTMSASGVGISGNLSTGSVLGPATSDGTLAVTGAAATVTVTDQDTTVQVGMTDSGDAVTGTVTDTDTIRRQSMAIITTPVP